MIEPKTVSGNFPRDLFGPIDERMAGVFDNGPCIWGRADSAILPLQFQPPPGHRTRIVALQGDMTAWIKSLQGDAPTPPESGAGVLMGFQTSSSSGTPDCTYAATGCPLYIQDAVMASMPKTRTPFDYQCDCLLDEDNLFHLKIAAWLNNTEKPIHIEATYTITYCFEPVPA
jgi:hypothetical protein